MKRYLRSAKKLEYVNTPEGSEPVKRFSITGFKNPGENASLSRSEEFITLRNALKTAKALADTYYCVIVREDTIYDRDFDTEISSSGPLVIFENGVARMAELKEPYKREMYNQISKYIDVEY